MPTPQKTWNAFLEMKADDDLLTNIWFSVRINIIGYLKCIIAALVVGFAIGLSPKVRRMFSQQVNALRFVPNNGIDGKYLLQ
jgi:NitT/TauT family transport system permease protein